MVLKSRYLSFSAHPRGTFSFVSCFCCGMRGLRCCTRLFSSCKLGFQGATRFFGFLILLFQFLCVKFE